MHCHCGTNNRAPRSLYGLSLLYGGLSLLYGGLLLLYGLSLLYGGFYYYMVVFYYCMVFHLGMEFAHYKIYTWTLCLSYLHEKQTSRTQSFYLYTLSKLSRFGYELSVLNNTTGRYLE